MIKHHFAKEAKAVELFKGVEKFKEFKKNLNGLGIFLPQNSPLTYRRNLDMDKNINKVLGDGFELFCELFILLMGTHPHIGLGDYVPINPDEDLGIDAFALNLNYEKSAVQIKFVNDPTFEFTTKSNLPNFLIEATKQKIDWAEETRIKRLYLITTAKGINYEVEKNWNNSVKVINIKTIELLTDNNKLFWNNCYNILMGELNGGL